MKPFNLEEALDGKPVVTRDGRKVTHITKIPNHNFIVGIIEGIPQIPQWAVNGNFLNDHYIHSCDLFMFIEEKVQWVNFWENTNGYIITTNHNREDQADLEIEEELNLKHIKKIRITL